MKFETMKIADLISEISMGPFGSNIKVECFVEEGIPVLNGSNLEGFVLKEDSFRYVTEEKADSLGKANAHRGDVVITHRGTLGQIVFIPQDSLHDRYVISQSQFRVKCNEKILPEYLVYYFHTRIGQHKLLSNASQVGVPALARASTTFQTIDIEVPDLESQKKIVGLLETIRQKVEINNEINDNLLQQAQLLYKDRFVDMTPFDGVMPNDWHEGTVSEIIELHDSQRIPLSSRERADLAKIYPYYGATSVMDYVDRYLFDGIYLLLGEDGTVVDAKGFPILQYVEGKFWVNNHAHILTGKNGFSVELLYLLFSMTNVQSIVTGAVQPKISQANLNKVPVVIPSIAELQAFDSLIQPIFAQIRNLRAENDRLAAIRDTLLPKLMSGELDVSDIAI